MRPVALASVISAALIVAAACESAPDSVETLDLGSVSLSDTGGYSGPIDVEIPADATSAIAYCGGFGDDALGAVWTLTDPDGGTVYSGDDGDVSQWRSEFLDDISPALLPLSPRLPLREGVWQFDWFVGAGNGGNLDCGAVIRAGAGESVGETATLLVEVVFVGIDLDAASAPDDAEWNRVMDQFESEWDSAGLAVSTIYKDFSGNLDRFSVVDVTVDDFSEFNDLLRTANPDDPRSITFFVVEEIANNSSGGATILGLAAGPPGLATLSGTSKSGVVVSGIDFRDNPEDVGKIMAHEGGHFLGLFHTTERDGSVTDPLGDTPECSNDANGDGTLQSGECDGSGTQNMMWWTLTEGTATMSADQGWVVRRNPVAQ